MIFFDDFEGADPGWTTIQFFGSPDDLWHKTTRDSYSPGNSYWWGQEIPGNYNTGNWSQTGLITPAIDLNGLSNAYLSFYERYDTEGGFGDLLPVDITTNDGTNWVPLRGNAPPLTPSGNSGGWVREQLDLTPFTNKIVKIRFLFSCNGWMDNYEGWFVDDVMITDINDMSGTGNASVNPDKAGTNFYGNWTFEYIADFSITNGEYSLTIPAGWSAPQNTVPAAAGFFTVRSNTNSLYLGTPVISGSGPWTITIPFTNLAFSNIIYLDYGSTNGGGPGALSPGTFGTNLFPMGIQDGTNASKTVKDIAIEVLYEAGFGTNNSFWTTPVWVNTTNDFTFDFMPENMFGALNGAYLDIHIPIVLDMPQTTNSSNAGFIDSMKMPPWVDYDALVISSNATHWIVTFENIYLQAFGPWFNINYNNIVSPSTPTNFVFRMFSYKYGSTPVEIAKSPILDIIDSLDGTGTANINPNPVYITNAADLSLVYWSQFNLTDPLITWEIPADWSEPQTNDPAAAGYVYLNFASPSVTNLYVTGSGPWTIHAAVQGPMSNFWTIQLRYTNVQTPLVPSNYIFDVQVRSGAGILTDIDIPPLLRLFGPDYLDISPTNDVMMETNGSWTLTYTAGRDISGEELVIQRPIGWSPFNISFTNFAGYTTITPGIGSPTLGAASTIELFFPGDLVLDITSMSAGDTIIIVYGNTSSGTQPDSAVRIQNNPGFAGFWGMVGPSMMWNMIQNQPDPIIVKAAGTGRARTVIGSNFIQGSTDNSGILFAYRSAGTMSTGEVSFDIPAGWSPPQTADTNLPGFISVFYPPAVGISTGSPVISGSGPWHVSIPVTEMPSFREFYIGYGIHSTNHAGIYLGKGLDAPGSTMSTQFTFYSYPSNGMNGLMTNIQPVIDVSLDPGYYGRGIVTINNTNNPPGFSNTWRITITADVDMSGSTLVFSPPEGWTTMQPFTPLISGYTTVTNSGAVISATNWLTELNLLTLTTTTMTVGQSITIVYGDDMNGGFPSGRAVPLSNNGFYTFSLGSGELSAQIPSWDNILPRVPVELTPDIIPPAVTVTTGPGSDFTTNDTFSIELSTDEADGYWSTNGTVWNSFTGFSGSIIISNSVTLYWYGEDIWGNTSLTNTADYVIDQVLPLVTFSNTNSWNAGIISLSGSITEAESGIRSNEISLYTNGSLSMPWLTMTVTGGPAVYVFTNSNFNTAALPNGTNSLTLRVQDEAGNTNWQDFTFLVDNTIPAVSLTNINNADLLDTQFVIRGEASDPESGIALTRIIISNNTGYSTNFPAELIGTSWQTNWDPGAVASGVYYIHALTTNQAGNGSLSTSYWFFAGFFPPDIAETANPAGAFIHWTNSFSGYATNQVTNFDPVDVYLSIDGAGASHAGQGPAWVTNVDTTGLTNGEHVFEITAVNAAGHSNNFILTNYVDNLKPVVSSVSVFNATNEILYGLSITGSDTHSGITNYLIGLSNSTAWSTNAWGNTLLRMVPLWPRGTVSNLEFIAIDRAGNMSDPWYLANVTNESFDDITQPVINFSLTNAWIAGSTNLTGSITEDLSTISNNEIYLYTNGDMSTVFTVGTVSGSLPNFNFNILLNTVLLPDGTNLITLMCTNDSTNNINSFTNMSFTILVDNEAPVVSWAVCDSPLTNGFITGLSITASDTHSGISNYIIGVSGGSLLITNDLPVLSSQLLDELNVSLTNIMDLVVYIRDRMGNISTPYTIMNVTNFWDISAPLILITNLSNWSAGNVSISGTVAEDFSDILDSTVYLFTNGNYTVPFTNTTISGSLPVYSFTMDLDTSLLPDGSNLIVFIASNDYAAYPSVGTNISFLMADNEKPVVSNFSADMPSTNGNLLNPVIWAQDMYSGISEVITGLSNGPLYTNSWPLTGMLSLPEFNVGMTNISNLVLMVIDNTGNISDPWYTPLLTNIFINDTSEPLILFSMTNSWLSGMTNLTGIISEDYSGIRDNMIYMYTNGDLAAPYTTGIVSGTLPSFTFSISIDVSVLPDGTNTINLMASNDSTNNLSTNTAFQLLIDNTAPTAVVPSLTEGPYDGIQILTLSASDALTPAGSLLLYFTLDGTDPTTSSTLYTNNITLTNEGSNILKVIAVDLAGNISGIFTNTYILSLNPFSSLGLSPDALSVLGSLGEDITISSARIINRRGVQIRDLLQDGTEYVSPGRLFDEAFSTEVLEYLALNDEAGAVSVLSEADQAVCILVKAGGNAGALFWDKNDDSGVRVRTGIYYVIIEAESGGQTSTITQVVVVSN